MPDIYKALLTHTYKKLIKEDAILILFDFLKQQIPFKTIICHVVNRQEMTRSQLIKYTSTFENHDSDYQMEKILPETTLFNLWGEDFNKICIMPNMNTDVTHAHLRHTFPKETVSAMTLCLYMSEQRHVHIALFLFSEFENTFTQEHAELINILRPFLSDLIVPYYLKNPSSFLYYNGVVKLPTTHEEQLRICPGMEKILKEIKNIASFDSTVLIEGATGIGKELIAETLHTCSKRAQQPFIRVNCGAIPDTLIESELFGYEKGAFTGAVQARKGYFEQANNGTIYLDEIGELSLNAQVRFLRVLENLEVQRIGSERTLYLDIRIIAGTNRDLWDMVLKKQFREDLYYRINTFHLKVRPLSERREDIIVLLSYFYNFYIQKFQIDQPPPLEYELLHQLYKYNWPGNIRQLKHAVERALVTAVSQGNNTLDFTFLPELQKNYSHYKKGSELSEEEIRMALTQTKGKIQGKDGAASFLNVHPSTLRSRMKILNISFAKEKKRRT